MGGYKLMTRRESVLTGFATHSRKNCYAIRVIDAICFKLYYTLRVEISKLSFDVHPQNLNIGPKLCPNRATKFWAEIFFLHF